MHTFPLLGASANFSYVSIGDCIDLDNEAINRIRTRDADPGAFLAIRFWAQQGVQVEIKDKNDPTPYWLISSKRGAELIKAIKT